MSSTPTSLVLAFGGREFALDVSDFAWPKYRGASARRVTVNFNGRRWDEFTSFFEGVGLQPCELIWRFPGSPGATAQTRTVVRVPGVYIRRARKVSSLRAVLWLYDARWWLNEAVNALDFNTTFAGSVLADTEAATYRTAIRAILTDLQQRGRLPVAWNADNVPETALEADVLLAALQSPSPIDYLCERCGCALTVENGRIMFAVTSEITAEWVASVAQLPWYTEPGFVIQQDRNKLLPSSVLVYAEERHTHRVWYDSPGSTRTSSERVALQWQQRYMVDDKPKTLAELCTHFGYTITDAQIAKYFLCDAAGRSDLDATELYPCNVTNQRVMWSIIRRDWRRLFKLDLPDGNGSWVDYAFGKLLAGGDVDSVALEVDWVEFRRTGITRLAGTDTMIGAPWSFNRSYADSAPPFSVAWVNGTAESGLVRLVYTGTNSDAFPAVPGELYVPRPAGVVDDALRITLKDELAAGTHMANLRNLTLTAREDISNGRFYDDFSMAVYVTATRRSPNSAERWWATEVLTGAKTDYTLVAELPPGEVKALRTYPGVVASDGYGPLLNQEELTADAERRVDALMMRLLGGDNVTGEAYGIHEVAVDGPVQEVVYAVEVDNMYRVKMLTRVTTGLLTNTEALRLAEDKRQAGRVYTLSGKLAR